MKLDLEMAIPQPVPSRKDPFALGWRYSKGERIPLTEEDLVYPKEGDFVVNNLAHNEDLAYLMAIFKARIADRPGLRLFGDHLIDFETQEVRKNLGPDLILFNGEPLEWNPMKAVFPVKRMKARPLFAIEITSPTTRRKDLTDKRELFYKVGIPVYVLIDLAYGGGKHPSGITAFQAGPTEYEELPPENGRVWLEVVEVYLASENDRVACYDPDGNRIEDYQGLAKHAAEAKELAETERKKSKREKKRADDEKRRADDEKHRADESERKVKELEAELRRLRGDAN
jgi:Uma2 family endonuclease